MSDETQLFRSFGDKSRNKSELSTQSDGMGQHYAWNVEVTFAPNSIDDDDKHFDGSYLAGVIGNWVIAGGYIEKWWGPSWNSSLILSNNARPVPGILLQRNYSDPFETPILSWVGPWTMNAFVGQLNDSRTISDAKLLGMSLTFKPLESIEVGFRRTAQWGGDGRPEDFNSLIDMLIGLDNCDEGDLSCSDNSREPGNQLAGIDLLWQAHLGPLSNIYMQMIGEDEAGYFPTKKSFIYGLSLRTFIDELPLTINIEASDTKVDGDGNIEGQPFTGYNVLYEHSIYNHGYRFNRRSIGSSFDNDSTNVSVTGIYQTDKYGKFKLAISNSKLNRDANNLSEPGGHSLVADKIDFNSLKLLWVLDNSDYGQVELGFAYRDKDIKSKLGSFDSVSYGLNWVYSF
nr:capsule assembly Wzi family protein [Pleionea sp. CnH1-48]